MAMGIPVVCNSGVGDVEEIMGKTKAGIAVKDFSEQSMIKAVQEIDTLFSADRKFIRQQALNFFSLEEGVNQYESVYRKIFSSA